jgi:hypothetical protein
VVITLKPTELEQNLTFFSVTEITTSKQDVSTINEWLTKFKNTISGSKWQLFNRIFTDWNNMSVVKYLDVVYESVSSDNKINGITFVHLCHAHIMKNRTDDISSAYEHIYKKTRC